MWLALSQHSALSTQHSLPAAALTADHFLNPWTWHYGSGDGWGSHANGLETFWPILVQGSLVSVTLGLLGCFLVVRGTSLLADALSHSVLPGVVMGFLIGAYLGNASLHSPWILVGATAVGLGAAILVQLVRDQSRIKEDASLGVVFTTMFALGVVMINLFAGQTDLDPGCVLYGDIVNFISDRDGIWPMAWITLGVVAGIIIFYRYLIVSTFDPGLARSLGIPVAVVQYGLMAVLSLAIVASFEAVGAILAVALVVLPGATARLLTDRMPRMLLLAAAHGLISTAIGYWFSHPSVSNTSASGAICVAGFGLFLTTWLVAPSTGLLSRWRSHRSLSQTMAVENLVKTVYEAAGPNASARAPVPMRTLSSELRLTPGAFAKAQNRAEKRGWIEQADDGLRLTPSGLEHSRRLAKAHVLWEQYLQTEMGLPGDHVHDAAEWVEHFLSDERIDQIDAELAARPAIEGR